MNENKDPMRPRLSAADERRVAVEAHTTPRSVRTYLNRSKKQHATTEDAIARALRVLGLVTPPPPPRIAPPQRELERGRSAPSSSSAQLPFELDRKSAAAGERDDGPDGAA